MPKHTDYDTPLPCGCSLKDGFCATHQYMMGAIHQVWRNTENVETLNAIWALSDGYGDPGFVPEQGYDWSGIRDSSTEAIEAMYEAATGKTVGDVRTAVGAILAAHAHG